MDETDLEQKSPIKRLGSTRKLLVFNSKFIFLKTHSTSKPMLNLNLDFKVGKLTNK